MTFKQLEYFAAVARTLSFTEAANEVFVSQPALSRGIVLSSAGMIGAAVPFYII